MMNKNIILVKLLTEIKTENFIIKLTEYLNSFNLYTFRVWEVSGAICEPVSYLESDIYGTFDIYELGYKDENISFNINKDINYFDITFHIDSALFLRHHNRITHVITFEHTLSDELKNELIELAPYLGLRAVELSTREKQMDLYVDYQKKVDFVKNASSIFKALEIDEVISLSLSFFMEVFSADAVCAVYNNKFYGIGVEESDIRENIFIDLNPIESYLYNLNNTHFSENEVTSNRFNIKNTFFVFENVLNIKFALFNIITDIIPDKDFSSLVSSIVSIAAENAVNHEKMMRFKVEETEIEHTADILNKFVKRTVEEKGYDNMYAISFPARNAGGDFVMFKIIGNECFFCIADVCGKGYSAAVLTVVLSVFSSSVREETVLEHKVAQVNKFLLSKNFDNRFITALFGKYNLDTRTITYISCGHDPAVVMSKHSVQYMKGDNLPLGIMDEEYKPKTIHVEEDSVIFLYTDGLIEYASLDDLLCLLKTMENKSAKEMTNQLYKELVTDKDLQRDDFTCLIMKV